jgi:hypothetical protein
VEALRGSVGYISSGIALTSSLTKAFLGRIEEAGVFVFGVRVAEDWAKRFERIKMDDDDDDDADDDDMQIGAEDSRER